MTWQGDWWPVLEADEFAVPRDLDVLIPTCNRPVELAATLAGLASTQLDGLAESAGIVISDQSEDWPVWSHPAVAGMIRILTYRGYSLHLAHHLPRRGMAEQRAFLLAHSRARYVLYLDDDVWLEPDAINRMLEAIGILKCGLVGNAVHGLSFLGDGRRNQQIYQEWVTPPAPEQVRPGSVVWQRAQLHSAANLAHLSSRLHIPKPQWRAYKIAWVGACALYDRVKLTRCGGFDFWRHVPESHCGEDVAAQLRVMARYGGAGIAPSGAYHLESETTIPIRRVQCYEFTH